MTKYDDLVAYFIGQLEQGTRPRSRSWQDRGFGRPLRHNGQPYHGMNTLALWIAAQERGFSSPYWMTFNQAKEFGAFVKKGAKASAVFKVGTIEREDDAGDAYVRTYVKCYSVFNTAEIEGLPAHFYPAPAADNSCPRIEAAEDFVTRTRADLRHGGNAAFYCPSTDHVQMPHFEQFESAQAYYATLLHELTHWTGHKARLDRTAHKRFGDPAYAFEELVAELGAAFLCADLQLSAEPRADHAPYLAHWAKALKAAPSILMAAAGAAERACEHLHGLQASVPAPIALAA